MSIEDVLNSASLALDNGSLFSPRKNDMALHPLVQRNISLDVRCSLKNTLLKAKKVTRFSYSPKLVPSKSIKNGGLGVKNAAQWAQIVTHATNGLKKKGYKVDKITLPGAQKLLNKPIIKTTDAIRKNIAKNLPNKFRM